MWRYREDRVDLFLAVHIVGQKTIETSWNKGNSNHVIAKNHNESNQVLEYLYMPERWILDQEKHLKLRWARPRATWSKLALFLAGVEPDDL